MSKRSNVLGFFSLNYVIFSFEVLQFLSFLQII